MKSQFKSQKRKIPKDTEHSVKVALPGCDESLLDDRVVSPRKKGRKQPRASETKDAEPSDKEKAIRDHAFFQALRAFQQQRGEDFYGTAIQRHFPAPAHWSLDADRQFYTPHAHEADCKGLDRRASSDVALKPKSEPESWNVSVEVATKLTAFIQGQQGEGAAAATVYVATCAQWVKESCSSGRKRYQLVLPAIRPSATAVERQAKQTAPFESKAPMGAIAIDSAASGIAVLATADELQRIYGHDAIQQHRRQRPLWSRSFGRCDCVKHKNPTQDGAIVPDRAMGCNTTQDPKLFNVVRECIDSIRDGWEPDIEPVLAVEPDTAALTKRLMRLQAQEHAITLEDIDAILQATQDREFDDRAVRKLGEITEADVKAQERQEQQAVVAGKRLAAKQQQSESGPQTMHQRKRLSRKLFGVLATWAREARAHGFELRKIPTVLVSCQRCQRVRVVDARASEKAQGEFVCGKPCQVNQDTGCGSADEVLTQGTAMTPVNADATAETPARGWVFVWMEPLKGLIY